MCPEMFQRGTDTWNLSKYSNDKEAKKGGVLVYTFSRQYKLGANAEIEVWYTWETASSSLFGKFNMPYKKITCIVIYTFFQKGFVVELCGFI